MSAFSNFNFSDFWNDAERTKTYTSTALTVDNINNAAISLGYALPGAKPQRVFKYTAHRFSSGGR